MATIKIISSIMLFLFVVLLASTPGRKSDIPSNKDREFCLDTLRTSNDIRAKLIENIINQYELIKKHPR